MFTKQILSIFSALGALDTFRSDFQVKKPSKNHQNTSNPLYSLIRGPQREFGPKSLQRPAGLYRRDNELSDKFLLGYQALGIILDGN